MRPEIAASANAATKLLSWSPQVVIAECSRISGARCRYFRSSSDSRENPFANNCGQSRTFAGTRATVRYHLLERGWNVPRLGNDRTAYIIGLFGTGRWYINELILQNIGERAKYFRDRIRFHPGPTSMIYSGHATMKHVSRVQALPAVTSRILEAVRSGFADLIFVYRHPLDSLLTNWIWWRTYIRDNTGDCWYFAGL